MSKRGKPLGADGCAHRHRDYGVRMAVKWLDAPEDHDYAAATDYLSLISEADVIGPTVAALESADTTQRKAKDILRAAGLVLLPANNPRVKTDLAKIAAGHRLSPVLLVRGKALDGVPLQIVDGYHRVCASYLTDENTPIPCRLVSWQQPG